MAKKTCTKNGVNYPGHNFVETGICIFCGCQGVMDDDGEWQSPSVGTDFETAINIIENHSAVINDRHYGITANDPHYYGGSQHNDDRLTAKRKGEVILVSDGNDYQIIDPADYDESELKDWLEDYMERGWD